MRILKVIIGVIAVLWIAVHVLHPVIYGIPTGDLATSWWMGKLVAILIGVIVAILCFRPAKQKAGESSN